MKTARFSQVVSDCGKPHLHLMLIAPEMDPALKRLARETRVMTVHLSSRGGRKDYGTVGLLKTPHAQVLIFPKSLRRYADRRVVGIHYNELEDSLPRQAVNARSSKPRSQYARPAPDKSPKAQVVPFAHDDASEPTPAPSLSDIGREIRAVQRLLQARRWAIGRERLARLLQKIETADKSRPEHRRGESSR